MTLMQTLTHWGEDIEAFLGSFVKSEVAAVAPLAVQSIAELTEQEATALTTGNGANTGHILAAVIQSTAAKAASAGLSVAPAAVAGAVGAAVAKASANAAKSS